MRCPLKKLLGYPQYANISKHDNPDFKQESTHKFKIPCCCITKPIIPKSKMIELTFNYIKDVKICYS